MALDPGDRRQSNKSRKLCHRVASLCNDLFANCYIPCMFQCILEILSNE